MNWAREKGFEVTDEERLIAAFKRMKKAEQRQVAKSEDSAKHWIAGIIGVVSAAIWSAISWLFAL